MEVQKKKKKYLVKTEMLDQSIYGEKAQADRSINRVLDEPVLFNSEVVRNNHQEIKDEISIAYQKYCHFVGEIVDPNMMTWMFYSYNLFTLTASNSIFYDLYLELRNFIRENISNEKLWMQSWMNIHDSETLYTEKGLSWHTHPWTYHGYIVVEPKKTITEFGTPKKKILFEKPKEFKKKTVVKNEIGNVYFFNGDLWHRVQPLDDSQWDLNNPRITIGFDINTIEDYRETAHSFIPLL